MSPTASIQVALLIRLANSISISVASGTSGSNPLSSSGESAANSIPQELLKHGCDLNSHPVCRSRGALVETFYFHDPSGIRLQIELKTKQDAESLEGDPDPVPYVRALLQRA
jgi:hypothetical protein